VDHPAATRARCTDGSPAHGEFTLRRLAHFVAVAEEGSNQRRGRALFMSQSAFAAPSPNWSARWHRSVRAAPGAGVSLTPWEAAARAGQATARRGGELTYRGARKRPELVGPLVVGCFRHARATVLPRLLAEFAQLQPPGDCRLRRGPAGSAGGGAARRARSRSP